MPLVCGWLALPVDGEPDAASASDEWRCHLCLDRVGDRLRDGNRDPVGAVSSHDCSPDQRGHGWA